jgi:outer membrane murein-binding lipoprotein Lpp
MDVKSYCDSAGIELSAWKAKLYDVIRKADTLSDTDKEKIEPMVNDLNSMVDELNARMAYLTRECSADWSDDEAAIEDKMTQLRGKWKEVWGAMGEHEYGLGGA